MRKTRSLLALLLVLALPMAVFSPLVALSGEDHSAKERSVLPYEEKQAVLERAEIALADWIKGEEGGASWEQRLPACELIYAQALMDSYFNEAAYSMLYFVDGGECVAYVIVHSATGAFVGAGPGRALRLEESKAILEARADVEYYYSVLDGIRFEFCVKRSGEAFLQRYNLLEERMLPLSIEIRSVEEGRARRRASVKRGAGPENAELA